MVGLAVASAGQGVQTTTAAFNDAGTVDSGVLGSIAVTSPTPTCTNVDGVLVLGNVARLTWTKADTRLEYTWELRRTSDDGVVNNGTVGTAGAAGSTVTLDISTGLLAINGTCGHPRASHLDPRRRDVVPVRVRVIRRTTVSIRRPEYAALNGMSRATARR